MKSWKRLLACCTVVSMVAVSVGGLIVSDTVTAEEKEIAALEETVEKITGDAGMNLHSDTAGKKETVYVIMDGDGNVSKTIVSSILKNPNGDVTLKDYSTLSDIKVVKGNAAVASNVNGNIEWKANGGDVYYQGTSNKELPVTVHVNYELDGKHVTAQEVAGASGHLKITFTYDNNEEKEVEIDGEKTTIYQPFTMVSGLILDNNKALNVTVTNGEVIDSGERTMAFGLAMPGLKESLGLNDLKDKNGKEIEVKIPDEVVVEADVIDFSLMMSLTVASNNALEKIGLDGIESLDDLKDDMNELKNGMNKIVDGATQLSDGVGKLSDGTGTLSDGVDQLYSGAKDLKAGAYKLADGAAAVNEGAAQLSNGLGDLKNNTPALAEGIAKLAEGANSLAEGVALVTANNESLNTGAEQIAGGLSELNAAMNDENTIAAMNGLVQGSADFGNGLSTASAGLDAIATGYSYNNEDIAALLGGLEAYAMALSANEETAAYGAYIQSLIGAYKGLYDSTATVAVGVSSLNDNYGAINGGIGTLAGNLVNISQAVGQLNAGAGSLQAGVAAYTNGVNGVAAGIESVDGGLNSLNAMVPTLVEGIERLSTGAATLANGTEELKKGSSSLADGTDKLSNGTDSLKNGVGDLVNGVSELLNGSTELKDGVIKFDEDGIDKLYDVINDSLNKYYDRLKEVQNYAKEYNSYAGCVDGMEASVKFIYKTAEIK